jgi:hypothetical protein
VKQNSTNPRASKGHAQTSGTAQGDAFNQSGGSPPAVNKPTLPPIAATLYAAYKTVFPIAFPAKHPPGWFGRWQWVNQNPPEPYQVKFYQSMPHDGWGLATGATSGIVVLDADVKDGKQGLQTMKALDFAAPHVRTASGGGHYYFKHPGRYVATRTNVLRDVDVRGDGGLVVFDGPGYSFVGDPLDLHEWDTLPPEVRLLLEAESRVGDLSINPQGLSVPPEIQGYALFPIDSDAEHLVPTWAEYAESDGSRDGAAFSLALTLLQKDYAPEGVLDLLLSEFLPLMPDKGPRNTFTAADVRKCVQSAWRIRANENAARRGNR